MTAIERDNTAVTRGPLFVIAGSHASLHWCVTILFVLLPFIKDELGLDYTQTGFLVTIVQLAAFVANIPSGIIVDVTGRRTACKLISLTVCGLGLAGLGFAQGYWALATFVAIISITNTLWHPAAIAFLSESYADRRGLALSFHTIGASLGDAARADVEEGLLGHGAPGSGARRGVSTLSGLWGRGAFSAAAGPFPCKSVTAPVIGSATRWKLPCI